MYCVNCGKQINKEANYCDNCGWMLKNQKKPKGKTASIVLGSFSLYFAFITISAISSVYYGYFENNVTVDGEARLAIFTMVFAGFFFSIVGLLLGLIGFLKARRLERNGFNVTTGLVMNAISNIICFVSLVMSIAYIFIA